MSFYHLRLPWDRSFTGPGRPRACIPDDPRPRYAPEGVPSTEEKVGSPTFARNRRLRHGPEPRSPPASLQEHAQRCDLRFSRAERLCGERLSSHPGGHHNGPRRLPRRHRPARLHRRLRRHHHGQPGRVPDPLSHRRRPGQAVLLREGLPVLPCPGHPSSGRLVSLLRIPHRGAQPVSPRRAKRRLTGKRPGRVTALPGGPDGPPELLRVERDLDFSGLFRGVSMGGRP